MARLGTMPSTTREIAHHPLRQQRLLRRLLLHLSNVKACMTSFNRLQILSRRLITRLPKCRRKKKQIVWIGRPMPKIRVHSRLNAFVYSFNVRSHCATTTTWLLNVLTSSRCSTGKLSWSVQKPVDRCIISITLILPSVKYPLPHILATHNF